MAKLSKVEQARFDGFNRACKIAREQGIDALLEEQRRRGISRFTVAISEADLKEQMNIWKQNILQTVLVMTIAVLRDEYGFGEKRITRFIRRFNQKSACLEADYLTWNDLAVQIWQETGIDCELPFFAAEEGEKRA